MPMLLLNGDVDQAVNNDANMQVSAQMYASLGVGARSNIRAVTIPYAGHTTTGQSPVQCTDAHDPALCTVGSDGVGINGPFAPACGASIAVSFIRNPAGPLNLTCLQHLFPLDLGGELALTRQTALAEFGVANLWDNTDAPPPAPPSGPPPPAASALNVGIAVGIGVGLPLAAVALVLGRRGGYCGRSVGQPYAPLSVVPDGV